MHCPRATRSAFQFAAFAGLFSLPSSASAEAPSPSCAARKSSSSARESVPNFFRASSNSVGSGGGSPAGISLLCVPSCAFPDKRKLQLRQQIARARLGVVPCKTTGFGVLNVLLRKFREYFLSEFR